MKFGLQTRVFKAVIDDTIDQFIASLSPLEKLDVVRSLDTANDTKNSLSNASELYDKYNVYTDITKMSLSQFIYLEYAIKAGAVYSSEVAGILLRPLAEKNFDNTNQEVEDQNIKSINEEEYESVAEVIQSMIRNREYILFTKFEGVIYSKVEKSEDEEEEEVEADSDVDFNERWFWYSIVRALANEDLQKFDFVYDMKMSDVLVEMAYRVQKSKKEENERRAEEARNAARSRI